MIRRSRSSPSRFAPALLLIVLVPAVPRMGGRQSTAARVAVVAELFTSEGCSSCPPADDLLRRLIDEQPIQGVEVIALGEHVDYWNHQGWKDPFSSSKFTARQQQYGQIIGDDRIYTPQLIVDGRAEMIGSDDAQVRKSLAEEAKAPHASMKMTATRDTDGRAVAVRVDANGIPPDDAKSGDLDVVLALVENGLVSEVKAGENARRTLHHSAVTRRLEVVGSLPKDATSGTATAKLPLATAWTADNMRIVAFLQHRGSRRICGAAMTAIQP